MSSQPIHFNLIEPHSNLGNQPLLRFRSKPSLRIPDNPYYQSYKPQILIKNTPTNQSYNSNSNNHLNYLTLQNSTNKQNSFTNQLIKSTSRTKIFQNLEASVYSTIAQHSHRNQNHRKNPGTIAIKKQPFIRESLRKSCTSQESTSISKRLSLLSNNSFKKQSFKRIKSSQALNCTSQRGYSLNNGMLLIGSLKQDNFQQLAKSNLTNEYSTEKCQIKSYSHHNNLSPLKFKLSQIPKVSELQQNVEKKTANKIMNRSDSFKKAIELSRQKKNQRKCNQKAILKNESRIELLNQEYYGNLNDQNQKENRYCLSNSVFQSSKLIRAPIKRQLLQNRNSCEQNSSIGHSTSGNFKILSKRSKQSSEIIVSNSDEAVNNSNMFSSKRDLELNINMQPY